MIVFLVLFILLSILLFLYHENGDSPSFLIPIVLSTILACVIWQTVDRVDIEPAPYKTIIYPDKVYVITDITRESFSTDKKVDYDNWTKEYPGQIWKSYNFFGKMISKEFHVKVPIE